MSYLQRDSSDCGPACLRVVANHYGHKLPLERIRQTARTTPEGTTLHGLREAAEAAGFSAVAVRLTTEQLESAPKPMISLIRDNHFVVVLSKNRSRVKIFDPARGKRWLRSSSFLTAWRQNGIDGCGRALLIEPSSEARTSVSTTGRQPHSVVARFTRNHARSFGKIALLMALLTGASLALPFLTKQVIDRGIGTGNIQLVSVLLLGQGTLVVSRLGLESVRTFLLVRLGWRLQHELATGFLQRLTRLPLSFFSSRTVGDILQRISDSERVERFVVRQGLTTVFGLINLFVLSLVLLYFDVKIFALQTAGLAASVLWVAAFMRARSQLDDSRFTEQATTHEVAVQLTEGITDIKAASAEDRFSQKWRKAHEAQFATQLKTSRLEELQRVGSQLINESRLLLVLFFSASAVIEGAMTLGGLLAIQSIQAQALLPLSRLTGFFATFQDARLSLERLAEVEDADEGQQEPVAQQGSLAARVHEPISGRGLGYRYQGALTPVFEDVDIALPSGSWTAVVGPSGCGKTTLLRILAGLTANFSGALFLGSREIDRDSTNSYLSIVGTVLQDGYVFSGSFAENIALDGKPVDPTRLAAALEISQLAELVESSTDGILTNIGRGGRGLSQGQKQRLLIARAVYKRPPILVFDEPTAALDPGTETRFWDALRAELQGSTVVFSTHRAASEREADQVFSMTEHAAALPLERHRRTKMDRLRRE